MRGYLYNDMGWTEAVSYIDGLDVEAYLLFLSTIPYSFYSVLAIAFVFMVAASGRDFGAMLNSERRVHDHSSRCV